MKEDITVKKNTLNKHRGLEKSNKGKKLHMDEGGLQWFDWLEPRATAEYSPLKITTSPQLDYRPQ